jgi:hypothetical protein
MAWKASPQRARWYGEVIFEGADGETTYNYGYSASKEEPDLDSLDCLMPKGYEAIERKIQPTPSNEAWEEWNQLRSDSE